MTDWVEKVSRTHGKTYWYNRRTKKSTWKRPPELGKEPKQAPTLPQPTSPVWTEPPTDDLSTKAVSHTAWPLAVSEEQ